MTYDDFNKAVACAGWETATTITCKCKGWYKASETILNPSIEEKIRLRHCLQDKETLSQADITQLQQQLKYVNKQNHDLVELAKARWYSGICANIHNMGINPRLAWKNIRLLTGGKTAHHKTNINIAMKLENG